LGFGYPSNAWFLGPTWVSPANGLMIGSAVRARLTVYPTHTDRQTTLRATAVAIGRIYVLRACDAA